MLPADRPDTRLILFERIDVDHPVEDHRMESSAGGVTGRFGGDRSAQAELGMRREIFGAMAERCGAKVNMLVPLREAQGNSRVELIFGQALGSGVHNADEFVILSMLFIEQ